MFSSRSSSSSSSMVKATRYDVFLSFRGEDTRLGFVSHLYKDLKHKKVETFIDDDKLGRGEGISKTLLKAIEESRVSVIVFSQNYASSKWCLDELVQIMHCKNLKPQHYFVLPVFYYVDPSHVRKQTGSFADAFAEHEETFKHDAERVKSWRIALTEAANLSGWDSQVTRDEATLVDEIVKDILKKLNSGTSCAYLKDYVGIERRMEQIILLFQRENPDFLKLGIWGMAGIGKTTLADAIFNLLSIDFESSYFLRDVRGSEERGTLHELREKFLPAILDDGNLNISAPTILSDFHKVRLSRKKVLVVCDNVTNSSQLEFLFRGIDQFGPGNRVIVTTRAKQVLIQNGIDLIYEVEKLDEADSVQLFCQRTFRDNHPKEYQLEISNKVLSFANGNPLAITVYGSSLYGKSPNDLESAVKKLMQVPNPDIHKLLRSSFDGLDSEEKDVFLDIACFYKGEDRDFVTRIMDACCYVSVHSAIDNLIDKSLISVSENKIEMHDLLQQMGQAIVWKESRSEPGRRSRLWNPDDIYNVLIENTGTETLQGMLLDTSRIRELELKPEAFVKMQKLKFLKFYFPYGKKSKILLPRGISSLPDELRYLCWMVFPSKTLPTGFNPRKLVELDMRYSNVVLLWEGRQDLVNLKKINFSYSRKLTGIPDLSSATNLVEMNLSFCTNLLEIPSLDKATSLTSLNLHGCSKFFRFPEISANIEKLYLGETAIEEVPSSIERLSNLCKLSLHHCWKLKSISTSIHKLQSLRGLYLGNCSRLENFPEILETKETLEYLDLSETALKELPSSIENLIGLVELSLENCENLVCLPDSFYKLKSLMKLRLGGCSRLEKFPEILGGHGDLEVY